MPKKLNQMLWDISRFGFTPGKLARRLFGEANCKIFCVSLPKAGTHLLERALCLHPSLYRTFIPTINDQNLPRYGGHEHLLDRLQPSQILVAHLRYSPVIEKCANDQNVRTIFLMRDPRDIIISQAHYIPKNPSHPFHEVVSRAEDFGSRLRLIIAGDPDAGFPSIGERFKAFAGWLGSGALPVRFEDLIGPSGGGAKEIQHQTLADIFRHIELPLEHEEVKKISSELVSTASPTYRRGRIGGWKECFEQEGVLDLFKESIGEELDRYGYS